MAEIRSQKEIEASQKSLTQRVQATPVQAVEEPDAKAPPKALHILPIGIFVFGAVGLLITPLSQPMAGGHTGPDPNLMEPLISCAVLAASLFVILAKRYSIKDKHWAYATVGTLFGFWLHVELLSMIAASTF